MKGLYKKISIGALASLLVFGSSLSNKSAVNALDYAGPIYNVQDMKNKKWVRCNLPDIRIIIGAYKIFGYDILYYNPEFKDFKQIMRERPYLYKQVNKFKNEHIFPNANRFLYYLYKYGMKAGFHRFKIGKQDVILLFNRDLKRGVKWWEHLDEWAFPSNEFLQSIRIMH